MLKTTKDKLVYFQHLFVHPLSFIMSFGLPALIGYVYAVYTGNLSAVEAPAVCLFQGLHGLLWFSTPLLHQFSLSHDRKRPTPLVTVQEIVG